MDENNDIDQIEQLSLRVAHLEATLAETTTPGHSPRPKVKRLRIVALALASLVIVGAVYAQSVPVFTELKYVLAGEPAKASDVNGNFDLLRRWLEQKVGTRGNAAVTMTSTLGVTGKTTTGGLDVTGDATVTGKTTSAEFDGAYTPRYQLWSSVGLGAGGAAIYNDNNSYDALMVVGNNAGGSDRQVRIYDDLWVNDRITTNNLVVNGNSLDVRIRNYVRANCYIRIAWSDSCNACSNTPPNQSPLAWASGTCTGGGSGNETQCMGGGYAGVGATGSQNGDETFSVRFYCN